ncbi:DNA repair protein RAD51 homolog 3-like isoform X2 [Anoplophora glabripennis]|uniref:DNA repair protein RAD51 homolog 3-like isoform X2 n=1 Tax=Anoplophora glabripennis TaxID=217634 RepID=UPI000874961F|nr:DNA repair protein RAD51 homolog 3-like isoform X2 [Anoplophora glabripennis]
MELNIAFLNLPKTTTFQLKQMGYNNVSDIEPNLIKEKFDVETNLCVPETKSALEIYNEELLNGCILSYNEKLDSVLLDAIIPKKITELAGESGSGKTQVCFHLCISVQLPKWCGGMEGEAIYIDTNSNFASHRVTAKMCEERWNQLVEMYKATNFAILHIALYEEMDQFLNKYCESADLSAEDFEEQIDFEELLASGFIDETYASPPSNIHLFSNGFCETEDEEFYSL